jgi:hypothetical protein
MLGFGRVFSSADIATVQLLFSIRSLGSIGALIAILVDSFKQDDMDEK